MKLLFILALALAAVGCGYSSKSTTPPAAGNIPAISGFVPPSANHGAPAFTLEIDGTLFGPQATVTFGGTAVPATWMNANTLQAMIPASAVTTAGQVQVIVTNPGTPGGIYGGGVSPEPSTPKSFTIN